MILTHPDNLKALKVANHPRYMGVPGGFPIDGFEVRVDADRKSVV